MNYWTTRVLSRKMKKDFHLADSRFLPIGDQLSFLPECEFLSTSHLFLWLLLVSYMACTSKGFSSSFKKKNIKGGNFSHFTCNRFCKTNQFQHFTGLKVLPSPSFWGNLFKFPPPRTEKGPNNCNISMDDGFDLQYLSFCFEYSSFINVKVFLTWSY